MESKLWCPQFSQKRNEKITILSSLLKIIRIVVFRSFFGRIEDIKNYLTGFDYISAKIPTETRFLEKI